MKNLNKNRKSVAKKLYGYDYWNYIGAGVAPCNQMPWWYKFECVVMTGGVSCNAGDIECRAST